MPSPLFSAEDAGIRDSINVVILDSDTYTRYWSEATSIPVEPVDFVREMALLAAAGTMVRGDRIQIDSLFLRNEPSEDADMVETLIIRFRIIEGCRRFPIETWPIHIVKAVRYTGRVRWEGRRERDCPGAPQAGARVPGMAAAFPR